jgi:hypothetical protein
VSVPVRRSGQGWLPILKERLGPRFGDEPLEPTGELNNLVRVLGILRRVMPYLNRMQDQVQVADSVKYDYLAEKLQDLLKLGSFSLAEYVYHQPGGHNPGIRIWVYYQEFGLTLSLLLFPQVGDWQVNGNGEKISTELLRLDLSGVEPKGWTSVLEGMDENTPWQDALVLGMAALLG